MLSRGRLDPVILSPSPLPPLLLPLCALLLRSDYCVLVTVPGAKEAEKLEADLAKIQQQHQTKEKDGWKGNFRVLCYSATEVSTRRVGGNLQEADSLTSSLALSLYLQPSSLEPFQRSLSAALSLRYPALPISASQQSTPSSSTMLGRPTHTPGDPRHPDAAQLPQLGAIFNLYALQRDPQPSASSALPALPAILKTLESTSLSHSVGLPAIHTYVPALGLVSSPSAFGEQLVTSANLLLARNLAIAYGATRLRASLKLVRVVVDVEGIELPTNAELASLSASAATSSSSAPNRAKSSSSKARATTSREPQSGLERILTPIRDAWVKLVQLVRSDASARTPWNACEQRILRTLHSCRGQNVWIGSGESELKAEFPATNTARWT